MSLKYPDIFEANNPNNAQLDSDFVRGGRRSPVADLTELYALASKVDQLKEQTTRVYVISEDKDYKLVDIADITAGVFNPTAWLLDTIDESNLVHRTGDEEISDIKTFNAVSNGDSIVIQEIGNTNKKTRFQGGGLLMTGGSDFPTYNSNLSATQLVLLNSGSGSQTSIVPNGVTTPYVNIKTEGGSFAGTIQTPTLTGNRSYTLPNATGDIPLKTSFSANSPLTYSSSTGVFSMPQASASVPGWLSASDYNRFYNYDIQGIYNNSGNTNPHIITTMVNGTSFTIRRGTSSDTDNLFRLQNGAGTTTFVVKGDGNATATDLVLSGYDNLSVGKDLAIANSTGLTSDGLLSVNADTSKFDLAAGTGEIIDYATNPANPTINKVSWSAMLANTVTNIATADKTYILVNGSGSIVQQTTFPTASERRANIFIGSIIHPNHSTIQNARTIPDFNQGIASQVFDFFDALGAFNVSGNKISPNGSNLSFNKSAGYIFRRGAYYQNDDQNPHVAPLAAGTPQSFIKASINAQIGSSVTVVDPANYDVSGTITAIPGGSNTSSIQRVYAFSSGLVFVQYGQNTYSSLADAKAAISTESFTINPAIADGGVLLGYIVLTKGCTSLNDSATCAILPAPRFDVGSGGGASSTTTMQGAYNNSATPQITTTTALGAIDFKRGSAADTDSVFRVLNGAGTATFSVNGNGGVSTSSTTITSSPTTSTGGYEFLTRNTSTGVVEKKSSTEVSSGTYTATTSNAVNATSLTVFGAKYMRIGNEVSVSAAVSLTATSIGAVSFDISLPFITNFTTAYEAIGVATSTKPSLTFGDVTSSSGTDNATVNIETTENSNGAVCFLQFQYTISEV